MKISGGLNFLGKRTGVKDKRKVRIKIYGRDRGSLRNLDLS